MKIELFHVGIATCVLRINEKIKIAIDPALSPKGTVFNFKLFKSKRLKEPQFDIDTFADIDLWLISHAHDDHIDQLGLEKIAPETLVLSSKNALPLLKNKNSKKIGWEQKHVFQKNDLSVTIMAIPAYHGSSYLMRTLVGKVNGYLLKIKEHNDTKEIYFTADTIYHNDVINILPSHVDLLIANLGNVLADKKGGPLTMNIPMLDSFVDKSTPEIVVPIHIDDLSHYDMTEEQVKQAGYDVLSVGKWHTLID